jgi:hypothetical protein
MKKHNSIILRLFAKSATADVYEAQRASLDGRINIGLFPPGWYGNASHRSLLSGFQLLKVEANKYNPSLQAS